MPHQRRVQRGSFGGHFDDLLTSVADGPAKPRKAARKRAKRRPPDERSIHDQLLECAWHSIAKPDNHGDAR